MFGLSFIVLQEGVMMLSPSFWQAAWVYWVKACQRLSWSNGNSARKYITIRLSSGKRLIMVQRTGVLSFSLYIASWLMLSKEDTSLTMSWARWVSAPLSLR